MIVKRAGPKVTIVALSLVLFIVCSALSLKTSGYVLPFGWRAEKTTSTSLGDLNIPSGYVAVCDRDVVEHGFPFTAMMPFDNESGCNDQYNLTAVILDVLSALVVSVGVSWFVVKTSRKRFDK